MMYCFNPDCPAPQQADPDRRCPACGAELRLRDRYSAVQLLGQGSSGRTFLAIDAGQQDAVQHPTKCVIKQLLPQVLPGAQAEQVASRFQQTAQRLQDLGEHPQIPRLLDWFEQAGQFYIVQEFIAGQNLAEVLKQQGAFTESQIWQLLTDLLPVIQFLHQHQVIHQDIKPENLIQGINAGNAALPPLCLVDFAAATLIAPEGLAVTGVGSPEYMAPEQVRGQAVYASDLYSLGVTCIHLLTEVSPFDLYDSLSDRWIWRACLTQPVSDRLAQGLDQLIQNSVSLRFQSAAQVLKALGIKSQSVPTQSSPTYTPSALISTASAIQAIALHPTAAVLATAGDDKAICLWDLTTQQRLRSLPSPANSAPIGLTRSLAFSADGRLLASAGDDKAIRLWDWQSGQQITLLKGHTGSVRSLQFGAGWLASGSWDKTVRLWQVATGEAITLKHDLQVTAVALSPDGKWLASGSCDRTARLWPLAAADPAEMAQNGCIVLSGHAWAVLAVAFSPDSSLLATGSEDNTVKLWQLPTGRLMRTLTGHSWAIAALAFSPNGKTLLSASWDKTIKLWDVADGKLQATLVGHTDSVHAIAIRPLPVGYQVWSGGRDRSIGQWPDKILG
ncbi:MAG TPA: serine/threonine-protein kinase [Coleofasciculaceae cyanobacterium]